MSQHLQQDLAEWFLQNVSTFQNFQFYDISRVEMNTFPDTNVVHVHVPSIIGGEA